MDQVYEEFKPENQLFAGARDYKKAPLIAKKSEDKTELIEP